MMQPNNQKKGQEISNTIDGVVEIAIFLKEIV